MNGAAVLKQIKPVIVFKGSEFARKNIKKPGLWENATLRINLKG